MGNMSYCRFENTLHDLQDCLESLEEGKTLSESEYHAYQRLVGVCQEIAENYATYNNPKDEDEDEEVACEQCGKTGEPLHTDFLCPDCHAAKGPYVMTRAETDGSCPQKCGGTMRLKYFPGTPNSSDGARTWYACDQCGHIHGIVYHEKVRA